MEKGNLTVPYANETDHYDCECHVQDSKHLRAERSWCLTEAMTRGLIEVVQLVTGPDSPGGARNRSCSQLRLSSLSENSFSTVRLGNLAQAMIDKSPF